MMFIKGEGKYSESLGKPAKQNNVINHEKLQRNQLKILIVKLKWSVQTQGSKMLSKVYTYYIL